MPITYYYRPDQKLIIFIHAGVVPDEEFLSFYRDFYKDPRLDKTFNRLVDLRQAKSSVRSSVVLKKFAAFVGTHTPLSATKPKVAVIAPTNISFGLARMYEGYSGFVPEDFTVFRAVDAALDWLRAPEDLMDNLNDDANP